jgi:hypothetical protein
MIDQYSSRVVHFALLLPSLLLLAPAWAEEEPARELEEFELPEYEQSLGPIGGVLDLDDTDVAGNPMQKLFKGWPDDLVVAPVPGYSPQLGWNLKLVGGYFLDPPEDRDHAASVLGGFGMIAQNGSYAYGGGANLHLLDDNLRVYDLYSDVLPNRDLVIPVRQDGPGFFVTGSWRIWKKLYAGIGYLGGNVDTNVRGHYSS